MNQQPLCLESRDKFSLLSGGGSAIAILGVLVYSLARQRHDAAVLKKQ